MLKDAKSQCDYLIAGIQIDPAHYTDYRAQTRKKQAPLYTIDERIEMFEAIRYVDEYFLYHTESDLYNWLVTNHWDIRILGSDGKARSSRATS